MLTIMIERSGSRIWIFSWTPSHLKGAKQNEKDKQIIETYQSQRSRDSCYCHISFCNCHKCHKCYLTLLTFQTHRTHYLYGVNWWDPSFQSKRRLRFLRSLEWKWQCCSKSTGKSVIMGKSSSEHSAFYPYFLNSHSITSWLSQNNESQSWDMKNFKGLITISSGFSTYHTGPVLGSPLHHSKLRWLFFCNLSRLDLDESKISHKWRNAPRDQQIPHSHLKKHP